MVKFTTTNIVGTPSKKSWSQAQSIAGSDNHEMMIVLRLTCDEEDTLMDLTSLGATILSGIERKCARNLTSAEMTTLVESVQSEATPGLRIDLLLASLDTTNLIICGRGSVGAYLTRDGKLAKLRAEWGEGGMVNGNIQEDDILVLATAEFVETITLNKFKEILIEEESPAELFIPLLHTHPETSGMAAIVGSFHKEAKAVRWPKINLRNMGNPKKMSLWIPAVVFILLIIMIGIGMVQRKKQIVEANFASLVESVSSKTQETVAIGDLNPERARYLLSSTKSEVEAYLATDIDDNYKRKAATLLEEISSADERAFKKNDIELSTVVELPILSEGLSANKMKSDGKGNLIFYDSKGGKVVSMNATDRSRQIIDSLGGDEFMDLGVSEAKTYGLNTSGVKELFWKKSDSKTVIEPDEFWKEPALMSIFAGNVYILDKAQNEIWKYPTLGDSYGGRRRWLAVGITPDLSNVIDMKVIGDIWLLTSTGKLERYSRGAPVAFSMEGFPSMSESKKLSNPSAVWVTDSLVYVLENGASRVVVFSEDGKYKSQYVNSNFAEASDLVVVDDKAYVLIKNVVKEFGL